MDLLLTSELEKFILHKIESGTYNDANEVVCAALRRMEEEELALNSDLWKDLRDFLAPRIAEAKAGNFVTKSFDSIMNELKNK